MSFTWLRIIGRTAGAVCLLVATAPAPAAGQSSGCTFGPGTGDFRSVEIPGAGRVTFVGRPYFVCPDGVRIRADSAVAYSAQNMSHLIGRVRYLDRTRELQSDEARYFSQAGRIQANGNVVLRDTVQGSEIRNGDLIYLRRTDFRDQEQITVTTGSDGVRPTALLFMKPAPVEPPADSAGAVRAADQPGDSAAAAADTAVGVEAPPLPLRTPADTVPTPYEVEGDRIFLQGDTYFLATGDVVIDRDSLTAFADSAEYDQVAARMLLKGAARVEGDTYVLTGRSINIALPGGEMEQVRALREATLRGEQIQLRAPLIQLFLAEGVMERLVATPIASDPDAPTGAEPDSADLARPIAEAEDFQLTADSVEVVAPGEVLDRIFAAGDARGVSMSRDSLNVAELPGIARSDWLEGDTIIATFSKVEPDPFLPPDTLADDYQLDELRALGDAKSLYRLLPSDSTARPGVDPPAVHYVTGSRILIVMLDGEVDRMEVEGPTHGWHLEPDRVRSARDSLIAPDSAVIPPDTGVARPDTARAPTSSGPRGGGEQEESRDRDEVALPGPKPVERGRSWRSVR